MARQSKITVNLDGLENLVGRLKGYQARVGVLGGSGARTESDGMTNAEIGVIHEFGNDKVPPRSWLRMPIEEKRRELVKFVGSGTVRGLLDRGDIVGVFKAIGVKAEAIVLSAFETKGFGKWPDNSPATIARKGSDKPLIDTSQLRRAVTSDVVKKGE